MQVTLKLATTLDGRIATRTGESQWITSSESRQIVHQLRAQHQAVLAGVNTVLADDPMLNVRGVELAEFGQPHRVVLDSNLRTPSGAKLIHQDDGKAIIICGALNEDEAALTAAGAFVEPVGFAADGRIDLVSALERLENKYSIRSVFIEGGGQVAASFLKAGLVDRLEWFRAPMLIGSDGVPALGELGVEHLKDALHFNRTGVRISGPDVWETYEKGSC
jgi:riboflavin-specific deaminase C-terminal domain